MKNVAYKTKVTSVELALTADQWQLYTEMLGVEDVADTLNKVLRKHILFHSTLANHSVHAVYGKMQDTLNEYSEFGASDTEPLYMVREILRDVYGLENCEDLY